MQSGLGVRDGELTLALDWPQRAKQSRSLTHSFSLGSVTASRARHLCPGCGDRSSGLGKLFLRRGEAGCRSGAGGVEGRRDGGPRGKEGLSGCHALLDSCPLLCPTPASAGRRSPDLSCGRLALSSPRTPGAVPEEPCGPTWPRELSAPGRVSLESESDLTVGRDPRDRVRSPGGAVEKVRGVGVKGPGVETWLVLLQLCGAQCADLWRFDDSALERGLGNVWLQWRSLAQPPHLAGGSRRPERK